MPMAMEWSDFKVLLALQRGGSVAGAARGLQVDNSTISRRLAALEQAVGARLLIRGGREFSFTAEGRSLLQAAHAMEVATADAMRAVHSARQEVQGLVRVAVPPGLVPLLVRLMLPSLREAHPLLDVALRSTHQRVDPDQGDADIAVCIARPDQPQLIARRAFDCDWFVYAAEAYLAAQGWPHSPDELAQHQLVLYLESMHEGLTALKWLEAWRGNARRLARVDSLEIACQTISAGGGIAVLPGFIADALPQLRRVFPAHIAQSPGWVAYHEAARGCLRIRAVAEALMGFFSAQRRLFSAGDSSGMPV